MRINPLTQTDFYKTGHIFQYPAGTTEVYSNFTPRSSRLANVLPEYFDDKVVWFGLQAFIKSYLLQIWDDGFFKRPKAEVVAAYKRRMDTSLGVDAVSGDHIAALHDLGYLPLEIKALPEGSRVNMRVPVLTVRNTHPSAYWLTNYLESVLSNSLFKPTTSATTAFEYRKLLQAYAAMTGSPQDFVLWQAHDFSYRGMSGMHDAAASSAGHLLSFYGTDTISALDYLEEFYLANADTELIGGSVPATEHSVMCMGGMDDEVQTIRRLITDVYPSGIISVVSDTWDFFKVITTHAQTLKAEILARTPNALGQAKVVFRPDSGDPVDILCGRAFEVVTDTSDAALDAVGKGITVVQFESRFYDVQTNPSAGRAKFRLKELSAAEVKGAVECLWDGFGGTLSAKGYKVLNERVGLIYGDSITLARAHAILERLRQKGFASCNVVFGVGSYSYQGVTRDTFGWAVKSTSGVVNGERRELFKDPATDNGTKRSAKGLLRVEQEGNDFVLYDQQSPEQEAQGALQTVFRDGKLLREESLSTIRQRLWAQLS
ncbi:MAG: nicotinate phosphoribosyltransferase [Polaromonas sp.]|nr:MAG: nicotinate phosphoribosyltransferase [Polaromonas sp.]